MDWKDVMLGILCILIVLAFAAMIVGLGYLILLADRLLGG